MSNIEVKIEPRESATGSSVVVASVDGKITLDECGHFGVCAGKIIGCDPKAAVLDCAGLTFVSSAGIGELIKLNRSLREQKSMMLLANVRPDVQKIFEASKLDEMLPMYESVDAAMLHV